MLNEALRRSRIVNFRASEEELAAITATAKAAGCRSVSEWVRQIALAAAKPKRARPAGGAL